MSWPGDALVNMPERSVNTTPDLIIIIKKRGSFSVFFFIGHRTLPFLTRSRGVNSCVLLNSTGHRLGWSVISA